MTVFLLCILVNLGVPVCGRSDVIVVGDFSQTMPVVDGKGAVKSVLDKKEIAPLKRKKSAFREFVITAVLTLLLLCASLMGYAPQRVFFIFKKTFSLNKRIYEFVSVYFPARANVLATSIACLLIAFELVYFRDCSRSNHEPLSTAYVDYLMLWGRMLVIVFACFIGKYVLINIVSKLFFLKEVSDIQFFEMINFMLLFGYVLLGFIMVDFFITNAITDRFGQLYVIVSLVLILYTVWFSFKFVLLSLHRKLVLISYLCATEIIPAIVLLNWLLE